MNITRVMKSLTSIPGILLTLTFIALVFTFFFFPNRNHNSQLDSAEPTTQRTEKPSLDNSNLSQNDPELLEYLLERHLLQPDPNLKRNSKDNSSIYAGKPMIGHIFGKKRNGTFIEAGANDGVFLSNTLALERKQGWTGLLIEPNDIVIPQLETSNRNAWIANVCLAVKPYPHKAKILQRRGTNPWYKGLDTLDPNVNRSGTNPSYKGQALMEPNAYIPPLPDYKKEEFFLVSEKECFPLYSLLAAIKMTTVDLFSLNVQGVEYKILKTIPFDCVDIKVIYVEHNLIPEGLSALKDLILSKGYDLYYKDGADAIFIKKGYKLAGNVPK